MARSPVRQSDPDPRQVLAKAVIRAAGILGLTRAMLARVLGISPSSVTRLYDGDYVLEPDSKTWEFAALLVRLYRGLDAIMAGDEQALRAWMVNPNTDLADTPRSLITTITGLVDVVSYVDAHRARL
jgi:hypothetical protein